MIDAVGQYRFRKPALPIRLPRSTSSKYMKNRGSNPPMDSNTDRRTSTQEPDNQPASRAVSSPLESRRYAVVHGFAAHRLEKSAWPTPVRRDGIARADGYT